MLGYCPVLLREDPHQTSVRHVNACYSKAAAIDVGRAAYESGECDGYGWREVESKPDGTVKRFIGPAVTVKHLPSFTPMRPNL